MDKDMTVLPLVSNQHENSSIAGVTHGLSKLIHKHAISVLSISGETAFGKTVIPHYLVVAKYFLDRVDISGLETYEWWRVRLNIIHQKLMSYSTEILLNAITKSFELMDDKFGNDSYDEICARYHVEKGLVDFHFMRTRFAQQSFARAKEVTGLYTNVTGKLGVKTKYQQFKTAQLVLEAKSRTCEKKEESILPQAAEHFEDSHLLERPKLDVEENEEDLTKTVLRVVDQVIILGMWYVVDSFVI